MKLHDAPSCLFLCGAMTFDRHKVVMDITFAEWCEVNIEFAEWLLCEVVHAMFGF